MLQNNLDEKGMSVVELMIGASLLALVIVLGSGLLGRIQKTARHDQNRLSSHKQAELLFELINRDAAVQANGGLSALTNPKGLEIKRLPQNADDASVTYTVRYQTSCETFPSQQQALLDQVYSAGNRAKIYQDPYTCMKSLSCSAGTYPVVKILLTGANPAAYAQKSFPGTALCAELIQDQMRMTIETVYSALDSKPIAAAVKQKVFVLPIKTVSDLDILPN